VLAGKRQHGGIDQLEKHQRGGKQDQLMVFQEVGDGSDLVGALPNSGIACARIVDLIGVYKSQRHESRNAQYGGHKEDCLLREIRAGKSHRGGGYCMTGRRKSVVSTGAQGHGAATDEAEADGANGWRYDSGGGAVQYFGAKYRVERRHCPDDDGGGTDHDKCRLQPMPASRRSRPQVYRLELELERRRAHPPSE
jgi:hypothetical protein